MPSYSSVFDNYTIQLTPINKFTKLSTSRVVNNSFEVFCENDETCEFYWCVHGTRNVIETEPVKVYTSIGGEYPYRYIC